MPIYEYNCTDCSSDFELLVRISEEPACPSCGSGAIEKQLSVPAAHAAENRLPVCEPSPPGGCGRPQCGTGGCMME